MYRSTLFLLIQDVQELDVQELNAFFTTLAYYSGNEVSLDTLSKSSGVEKNLKNKVGMEIKSAMSEMISIETSLKNLKKIIDKIF